MFYSGIGIHLSVFDVDDGASSCGDEILDVVASMPVWDLDSDDDDDDAAAADAAVSLVSDADGDLRILFALNGGIGSI